MYYIYITWQSHCLRQICKRNKGTQRLLLRLCRRPVSQKSNKTKALGQHVLHAVVEAVSKCQTFFWFSGKVTPFLCYGFSVSSKSFSAFKAVGGRGSGVVICLPGRTSKLHAPSPGWSHDQTSGFEDFLEKSLPPSSGQSHPHKSSFQVCTREQHNFRLSIKATAKTQALEAFWPSHILQVLLKVTTRSRALKGCWRTCPPSMDSGPNVKLWRPSWQTQTLEALVEMTTKSQRIEILWQNHAPQSQALKALWQTHAGWLLVQPTTKTLVESPAKS